MTITRWSEENYNKDNLKVFLKDCNIPLESWEAQNRAKWCCLIRKGADEYEAKSLGSRKKSEPMDHYKSRYFQN